jgi:hypothetical protein
MRIYIIGNDGITLCGEPPAAVNEGEIVVASSEELHAARLLHQRQLEPQRHRGDSERDADRWVAARRKGPVRRRVQIVDPAAIIRQPLGSGRLSYST